MFKLQKYEKKCIRHRQSSVKNTEHMESAPYSNAHNIPPEENPPQEGPVIHPNGSSFTQNRSRRVSAPKEARNMCG